MCAVISKKIDMAEWLLTEKVNIHERKGQRNALSLAIIFHDTQMVDFLFTDRAHIEEDIYRIMTPMTLAVIYSYIKWG